MSNSVRNLSEIGESALIERLQQILPANNSPDVIQGIGDDTAVIRLDQQRALLVTCDVHIETVHFDLDQITPYQLGRRVISVNLSDLAAMGGTPRFALISLALPGSMTEIFFEELQNGFRDQLSRYQVIAIGGNLSVSPDRVIVDVTLIGEIPVLDIVKRNGATAGNRIFITGQPGASAAGRHLLTREYKRESPLHKSLVSAFLQPIPRVETGKMIASAHLATAMIDVSDGLAADLAHICRSSGVGAEIMAEKLPCSPELKVLSREIGTNIWEMILHGGEDYELLFTADENIPESRIQQVASRTGTQITEIGSILPVSEGITFIDLEGQRVALDTRGWDHFR